MSHRVTVQSEIKNKDIAISALKSAGMGFSDHGTWLKITTGPLRNVKIALTTGELQGDTDFKHTEELLETFRAMYTEANFLEQVQVEGVQIKSREVLENGDIRYLCQGNFG